MICSPSGFCFSSSWSMVSCGKRGSLLVAGARKHRGGKPAAGGGNRERRHPDCRFHDFLPVLFVAGEASPAAARRASRSARMSALRRSDRADVGEALLRDGHALGDMARLAAIHVQREHGLRARPSRPSRPSSPATACRASAPSRPLLARMTASPTLVTGRMSRTRSWLRLETGSTPRRSRSTKSTCCTGSMRRLPVSQNWSMPPPISRLPYSNRSTIFLHPLRADAPRDLLIDRHRRRGDRRAHGVVADSRPRCCASRRPI